MKLAEIRKIEGTITLKSGLHIGSGNMEMHIGGTDSPVIKHPHTREPYIPGSSLKGKVRSLLEMESGLIVHTRGDVVTGKTLKKVAGDPESTKRCTAILKVFGASGGDVDEELDLGPTRVSFSDCYLDESWKETAKENQWLLTEEKSENKINRVTGVAEHPRFIERVPEGTRFRFLVTFKVLQDGDADLFDTFLLKGLKLLEMDTIGGSGSRGYGRIELGFDDTKIGEAFRALNVF